MRQEKEGSHMNILLVALGGFVGSISRYYVSVKMPKSLCGTWIANITGSLLLAILLKLYLTGTISDFLWLLIGVGFCGAYTTFSTFGNETLVLIQEQKYKHATVYVFSSICMSLLIVGIVINLF